MPQLCPFHSCAKIGSCDPIMAGRLTFILWCNVTKRIWEVVVTAYIVSYYSTKTYNRFGNLKKKFSFSFFPYRYTYIYLRILYFIIICILCAYNRLNSLSVKLFLTNNIIAGVRLIIFRLGRKTANRHRSHVVVSLYYDTIDDKNLSPVMITKHKY